MTRLPRARSSFGFVVPDCPWCSAIMDDATVRLADLVDGWSGETPDWPLREKDGRAGSPLVTDCPTCHRPSMIALAGASTGMAGDARYVRLVPVRTPTDARLIAGEA